MNDENKGFFVKDILEQAVKDKMKNASDKEFADIISVLFNCQCYPNKNWNDFTVLFIDNCNELQPYIEKD